jgi:hypothetical protein
VLDRADPRGLRDPLGLRESGGPAGPEGPKGDPGPAPAIRVVTGTDSVPCGDDEVLAGFVCASGATAGAKCATPGAAVTGLCVVGDLLHSPRGGIRGDPRAMDHRLNRYCAYWRKAFASSRSTVR